MKGRNSIVVVVLAGTAISTEAWADWNGNDCTATGLCLWEGTGVGNSIVIGCRDFNSRMYVCWNDTWYENPESDNCTLSYDYRVDGLGGGDTIRILKEGETFTCDGGTMRGLTDTQWNGHFIDARGGDSNDWIYQGSSTATDTGDTGDSIARGDAGDDKILVRGGDPPGGSVTFFGWGDGSSGEDQVCSIHAYGGEKMYGSTEDDCLDDDAHLDDPAVFWCEGGNDSYDDDFAEDCTDSAGFCQTCNITTSTCACLT